MVRWIRGAHTNHTISWYQLSSELLFVQNYFGGLWNHTWSLAVEEHFYLGLAVLFLFLTKRGGPNPFTSIPWICGVVALVCIALRLRDIPYPYDFLSHLARTHKRVDSLLFGTLLSYYYHFFRDCTLAIVRKIKYPLLIMCGLAFCPVFLFDRELTPWFVAIWPSVLYVPSGGLLLSFLESGFSGPAFLSRVGVYSYSIYLWHMPVLSAISVLARKLPLLSNDSVASLTSGGLSVFVGILLGMIVEYPVLHFRDRLYPSRS